MKIYSIPVTASLIVQGPFIFSTFQFITKLVEIFGDMEIIYSTNTRLDEEIKQAFKLLNVKVVENDYLLPQIKKFNSNSFMNYNNSIVGIRNGVKQSCSNCVIVLRSDLKISNFKKLNKGINKYIESNLIFLTTDTTSRHHHKGPIYHLSDWIIGEKKNGNKYFKLESIEIVDEKALYNYWPQKIDEDHNQRFGLEQIIWMHLLDPKIPPYDIINYSNDSLNEYQNLCKHVLMINLIDIGLKSNKYKNIHLPQKGRMRKALFNYFKNSNIWNRSIMYFDELIINFFGIMRKIYKTVKI